MSLTLPCRQDKLSRSHTDCTFLSAFPEVPTWLAPQTIPLCAIPRVAQYSYGQKNLIEKNGRIYWLKLAKNLSKAQFLILKGRTFSRQMLAFKKFHFFYASFCNIEETREIRKSYLRGHIVSHTEIGHSVTLKKNLFYWCQPSIEKLSDEFQLTFA